jgi:hypothetical protein
LHQAEDAKITKKLKQETEYEQLYIQPLNQTHAEKMEFYSKVLAGKGEYIPPV